MSPLLSEKYPMEKLNRGYKFIFGLVWSEFQKNFERIAKPSDFSGQYHSSQNSLRIPMTIGFGYHRSKATSKRCNPIVDGIFLIYSIIVKEFHQIFLIRTLQVRIIQKFRWQWNNSCSKQNCLLKLKSKGCQSKCIVQWSFNPH